jgi:isoleucyl-tRNA synthetase
MITSKATLLRAASEADARITVTASECVKCERCWHYVDDVGSVAAHPSLCKRCDSNINGSGEVRAFA